MKDGSKVSVPFDSDVRVDLERLWRSIGQSAEIVTGRPGGLARLSLTDSDKAMRDLFVTWCEQASLAVTIDELGNIFAWRDGLSNGAAPILIGSHSRCSARAARSTS